MALHDLTHLSPDEARQRLHERVTEAELQAQVVRFARTRQWLVYHTTIAYRSAPGFPDLILVRSGRLVAAELKREKGVITEAQRIWLAALRACPGVEAYVWRPSDLTAILECLK